MQSDTAGYRLLDSNVYRKFLGVQQNTLAGVGVLASYYTGFIWEICYTPTVVTTFVDDGPCVASRCTHCPAGPVCLIDCEWEQWLDGEICTDCETECTEGCVRQENCNPCLDDTCDHCPMWEDCLSCIENADLVDGNCECNKGYYYDEEQDACVPCDIACGNCTDDTIWTCDECKEGFYLHRDADICRPHCPSGFDSDDATATCINDPIDVFCLTFNQQ